MAGSTTYSPSPGTIRVLLSALKLEPVGSSIKITEVESRLPSSSRSLARISIATGVSSEVLPLSFTATGGSLTSLTVIFISPISVALSSSVT